MQQGASDPPGVGEEVSCALSSGLCLGRSLPGVHMLTLRSPEGSRRGKGVHNALSIRKARTQTWQMCYLAITTSLGFVFPQ